MKRKITLNIVTISKDNLQEFKRTFESVSSQTSLEKFKVYFTIVDSSDNTLIKDYVETTPLENSICISYHYMTPSGIYPAINYGINRNEADYIHILNSGDIYGHSLAINTALSYLNNNCISYYYGCFLYTKNFQDFYAPHSKLLFKPFFCHQAFIYSSGYHLEYGYYSAKYISAADYHFFTRIFRGKPWPSASEEKLPFVVRLKTPDSSSNTLKNKLEMIAIAYHCRQEDLLICLARLLTSLSFKTYVKLKKLAN